MFELALQELNQSESPIGKAQSFQDYLARQGVINRKTAPYISINNLADLQPELREAKCMVFRLGSPTGDKNTHFALASTTNGLSDFFFIDEEIFSSIDPDIFLPNTSIRSLFAYQILPKLTETSVVNLAIASGLLPMALGISKTGEQIIPATGQSTFTFDFQPLAGIEAVLTHNQGQVEIDALFVGQRNNKECIFVIEAKTSKKFDSLSKHKLLYPILALKNKIPSYMEVVPVYLRVIRKKDCIEFNIAECSIPHDRGVYGALDQLKVNHVTRYNLHGY